MPNYFLMCDNVNHRGDDTLCLFSLDDGDGRWLDSTSYCYFSAIKDAVAVGGRILVIGELDERHRILGTVNQSGSFEAGYYFVDIERPISLAASETGRIAVAHTKGVAVLTLSEGRLSVVRNHIYSSLQVMCAGYLREELVVALHDQKSMRSSLVSVDGDKVIWVESKQRNLTKMISWMGRLVVGDAYNAELIVVGQGNVDYLPLNRGFVRPLSVQADGGLLVARNGWRRLTRRSGNLKRRDWSTLPAWAQDCRFEDIIGADLVRLNASGAVVQTTPVSHLTTEAAALLPSGMPLSRPYTAANDRALRAQEYFEAQMISLRKALAAAKP